MRDIKIEAAISQLKIVAVWQQEVEQKSRDRRPKLLVTSHWLFSVFAVLCSSAAKLKRDFCFINLLQLVTMMMTMTVLLNCGRLLLLLLCCFC